MEKVLIVGGVAGGASAAARLRRLREDLEITVLERGPFVSFANCGLPYYIGQVIKEEKRLKLMTPKRFLDRFNIDIQINHEVKSIDKASKKITVENLINGNTIILNYDFLILSPGAAPIVPPFPGIADVPVFTLRNIPDSNIIKQYIEGNDVTHATVIGGGFIGLEMAENLRHRGVKVKIVELLDQVMASLDKEIAQFIHQELLLNGVCLHLEDPVDSFKVDSEGFYYVITKSGERIKTDMIILAIGVKPENRLAKEAGLDIGPKGHIIVDEQMRTSDPSIFAVGDAIQIKNFITKQPMGAPLAGPANKQGRIVADVIGDRNSRYKGVLAAIVVKIFDLTVASVGLSEKQLNLTDIAFEKIYVHPNNHAGYYPGAEPITLKLIFETPSGKILGAQAVGGSGTEKRIDIISTAIKFDGTVFDLEELELSYSPPYSSAKDPVNMAGFVASNVLRGDMPIWHWDDLEEIQESTNILLDVRTPGEFRVGTLKGALNISDTDLRVRIDELPKDKKIYIFCQVGFRGYLSTRLLLQKGYDALNMTGGYKLYKIAQATTEELAAECGTSEDIVEELIKKKSKITEDYFEVDASGLTCPGPLNALVQSLEKLPENKKLRIYATDLGFKASVEAYAELNETIKLLDLKKEKGRLVAILEKTSLTFSESELPLKPVKKSRKELRSLDAPALSDISANELYERLGTEKAPTLMIDVRTPQEYNGRAGHIKNTESLPLGELMHKIDFLDKYKEEEIVVICHSGSRSMMAAQLLVRAGYKDVRNLTGGMLVWHRKGYPVETI
jgi:NADPH-dependent 2,4-dienoyl-CoA reductase/sulfur reductase-like enzyme/rhodanese-related sulfurtransferase/TusA-related sulfurtransferase